MSDTIGLSDSTCPCGRAFGLVEAIEGRREDVLLLPSVTGAATTVHPNVFHRVLEPLPVRQWQIEQVADALVLRLVPGTTPVDSETVAASLQRDLIAADAAPMQIRVERVDAIAKTTLGKAPLIKALRR
jgi:phenylacetate-coenzyme A ligase PaaK-like adenylate-forming protein